MSVSTDRRISGDNLEDREDFNDSGSCGEALSPTCEKLSSTSKMGDEFSGAAGADVAGTGDLADPGVVPLATPMALHGDFESDFEDS